MSEPYDTSNLVVLEGLEPVRRRPSMYIGSTDARGLEHLLFELVGNALDEYLAQRARRLSLHLDDEGWLTVEDDGRGLPLRTSRELERIFLTVHSGATLDGHHPHVHVTPTLHGAGLAVVNALSARLEVESCHDGVLATAAFERGVLVRSLELRASAATSGTRLRSLPDPEIFGAARLERGPLAERLEELAWLCPGLDLSFQGTSLRRPDGPAGWVAALAGGELVTGSVVHRTGMVGEVEVELAYGWRSRPAPPEVHAFVNYARTKAGSHVDGLLEALANQHPTAGLVAVVHVGLLHPRFGGPTRAVLEHEAARLAVAAVLARGG